MIKRTDIQYLKAKVSRSLFTGLYANENYVPDWECFGELWDWAKEKKWWQEFLAMNGNRFHNPKEWSNVFSRYINPEAFIKRLMFFLKRRDQEIKRRRKNKKKSSRYERKTGTLYDSWIDDKYEK